MRNNPMMTAGHPSRVKAGSRPPSLRCGPSGDTRHPTVPAPEAGNRASDDGASPMPKHLYTFAGYDELGIPVFIEEREATRPNAIATAELLLMMDGDLGSVEVLEPLSRTDEETTYLIIHKARVPWN